TAFGAGGCCASTSNFFVPAPASHAHSLPSTPPAAACLPSADSATASTQSDGPISTFPALPSAGVNSCTLPSSPPTASSLPSPDPRRRQAPPPRPRLDGAGRLVARRHRPDVDLAVRRRRHDGSPRRLHRRDHPLVCALDRLRRRSDPVLVLLARPHVQAAVL